MIFSLFFLFRYVIIWCDETTTTTWDIEFGMDGGEVEFETLCDDGSERETDIASQLASLTDFWKAEE